MVLSVCRGDTRRDQWFNDDHNHQQQLPLISCELISPPRIDPEGCRKQKWRLAGCIFRTKIRSLVYILVVRTSYHQAQVPQRGRIIHKIKHIKEERTRSPRKKRHLLLLLLLSAPNFLLLQSPSVGLIRRSLSARYPHRLEPACSLLVRALGVVRRRRVWGSVQRRHCYVEAVVVGDGGVECALVWV